jgi:hypothetical protein
MIAWVDHWDGSLWNGSLWNGSGLASAPSAYPGSFTGTSSSAGLAFPVPESGAVCSGWFGAASVGSTLPQFLKAEWGTVRLHPFYPSAVPESGVGYGRAPFASSAVLESGVGMTVVGSHWP